MYLMFVIVAQQEKYGGYGIIGTGLSQLVC